MTAEQKLIEAADNAYPIDKSLEVHERVVPKLNRLAFVIGAKSESAKEWHNQWIPVSEKLPPEGKTVIMYDGNVFPGWYMHTDSKTASKFRTSLGVRPHVTHWMPLPSSPEI